MSHFATVTALLRMDHSGKRIHPAVGMIELPESMISEYIEWRYVSEEEMDTINNLTQALEWALEYIDAIPSDAAASFPTMPGFDRDYVNTLISDTKRK